MKRLVSLVAMVLTLTMVLSLAACGNDDANPDQATDSTQVQTGDTDALNNLYGITADQVASSASFNATSGAAFPQEVVMIQAVDASAASDIAAKLESRLNTIAETAASYDPTSLELAENCPVVTNGVYVGMFFSSHYDDMVAAFQNALA